MSRTMSHQWFRAGNRVVPVFMGPHPHELIWAVRAPRTHGMLMVLTAASVPFVIVKSGDTAWEVH